MLPKSQRLSRREFTPLLESKKYLNSPHFSLKMADSSHLQAAVSVSKKVARHAVDRNRLRRRAYGVLSKISLPKKKFLLIARTGAGELSYEALYHELVSLFKKS